MEPVPQKLIIPIFTDTYKFFQRSHHVEKKLNFAARCSANAALMLQIPEPHLLGCDKKKATPSYRGRCFLATRHRATQAARS